MAIDNLPVSSIPDFSRFLEWNVRTCKPKCKPGHNTNTNTGQGNGRKGGQSRKQNLALYFSLSSRRRKGQRIERKRKKEGDWDFPRPLPFLRQPRRHSKHHHARGTFENWDMVGSKTCTLTMWLNPREWTEMFSCLLPWPETWQERWVIGQIARNSFRPKFCRPKFYQVSYTEK